MLLSRASGHEPSNYYSYYFDRMQIYANKGMQTINYELLYICKFMNSAANNFEGKW